MKKLLLVLPIALLSSCGNSKKSSAEHFKNSIEYVNEANMISNGGNGYYYEDSEIEDMVSLKQKALDEARKVSISSLNKRFPGFGDSYENLFVNGLILFIDGIEDGNQSKLMKGQFLLDEWGDWYSCNRDRIQYGKYIKIPF